MSRLVELITGVVLTAALGTAARHRVADHLAEAPMSAEEIAQRTGTDPDALFRTLRLLASAGVFELREDRTFANTSLSNDLKSNSRASLRAFAEYFGSESNLRAFSALEHTLNTGENAFEHVHGKSIWKWFEEHPLEGRVFSEQMSMFTTLTAAPLARSYPFSRLRRLCDVSGGKGTLLAEILLAYPELRGILFEQARVLEMAEPLLRSRGVLDRVRRVSGDIFESAPPPADGYLLKDILHDWDDKNARKILQHIRTAAEPGTRLILVEVVLEPDELNLQKAVYDVHMMTAFSEGRQRSRAEFERLLTDTGFRLNKIVPVMTFHSLLDGTAV